MLVVNCFDITNISDADYIVLKNAVSDERRIKAERFHFIDDAKRSIIAELILRYSLYQAGLHMTELNIGYNKFGKPYLKDADRFRYNLSHSGKWVVIAYGSNEVGIDVEKVGTGNENIADRFFTGQERQFIIRGSGKERAERFTQIWTLKESFIKYLGTGLSTDLRSFTVDLMHGTVKDQNGEVYGNLRLKCFPFDKEYFISVCSTEEDVDFNVIKPEDISQFFIHK